MNRAQRYLNGYMFTLPSLIFTLVLGVYPILWAFRYMFYDYKGYGVARYVGLGNFERLFRDDMFWNSVQNTFVYAGGKILLTLPLSLLLAVILNRKLRGRNFLRALIFMPTIISAAVMAIIFFIIFNSYNGILNQLLIKYGIVSEAVDWLGPDHAMMTVILIAVWSAVGNYMLLFMAGLQSIPEDLYESASLDGASPVQQFRYITVPMLGPVIQMILMLAIITALKGYESIMVLTEGGPFGSTEVMFLYVYKLLFPVSMGAVVEQQIGYGSAVGFTSAVIVSLITVVYFYASKKLNDVH
ncbi:MAG: transporter, permease protein [Paenibacillus sp.]|nr:transporter, permease protein [Paenibacillus sp.]